MRRLLVNSSLVILFALAAGHAQKIDPWLLNNARIGPNSPIEMAPGSSYNARVEYPNPDGPMSPLKANVSWSIAPAVEGIHVDPTTGKITVDSSVIAGATAIVHASINDGVRKISAKVVVFSPSENPLQGDWIVQSVVFCDPTQKSPVPFSVPQASDHFKFYVDHKIYIGRPIGIAATTRLSGDYQLDLKTSTLKINPTWPKGRASEEWMFEISEENKLKLDLPASARDEKTQVCGYLLSRNQPAAFGPKAQ